VRASVVNRPSRHGRSISDGRSITVSHMSAPGYRDVTTADGRTLHVLEAGAPDGPALVVHHGTPGSAALYRSELESAAGHGLRLIGYDRPGYGGSTPHRGRSVADAAADVAAILDALGVERFATYGTSGGGPHALACAALLPGRCAAAATIASVGPADAADLDFMAGMGAGNVAEFAAAREGRERLTEHCRVDAAGMASAEPGEFADAMRPHLSDADVRVLTGEFAAHLLESTTAGLEPGVEGWVDDDFAFLAPWGFDVEAIRVPVLVWQGEQDLMVPAGHGRWLGEHVGGAETRLSPEEGHLTLFVNRVGDVHAWLRDATDPR
jgi:pimeloyl-ACP methyl ester carboxylesterase